MKKSWILGMAALAAGYSGHAFSMEMYGYFRTGLGSTTHGGKQQCFQLPGADSKYRLGNECEQYGEFGVQHDLKKFDDGSSLGFVAMPGFKADYGHDTDFHGPTGYARMVEGYVQYKNAPELSGGTFWAGTRYYRRNQIAISDYYYSNPSGTGFGVENAEFNGLKWSYAFFRRDNPFQKTNVTRHDFNVSGFQTNPGGAAEVGFSYVPEAEPVKSGGWAIFVQHKQQEVLGGVNTAVFQYGEGAGTGLGGVSLGSVSRSDKIWIALDTLDWEFSKSWSGAVNAVYKKTQKSDGTEIRWSSFGVRPVYSFARQFKLIAELGIDQVKKGGANARLTKFTFAPAWSPKGGGLNTRPELRVFYTYAKWNKDAQQLSDLNAQNTALSSTGVFGGNMHGSSFGVQLEYWWP